MLLLEVSVFGRKSTPTSFFIDSEEYLPLLPTRFDFYVLSKSMRWYFMKQTGDLAHILEADLN